LGVEVVTNGRMGMMGLKIPHLGVVVVDKWLLHVGVAKLIVVVKNQIFVKI
jgi:hypothetical protein